MKHGINLYHESLRPSQELLTSARLLVCLLIILVTCIFVRGGDEYAIAKVVSAQAKAQIQQAELSGRMVELAGELSRQRQDRSLLRRTERIELDVESRRALLDEFNRRGKIRRANLSPVLQELASIHVEGLWLTRISIQADGVELEGHTLAPNLIPHWMAKFASASTLASHQFSVVELRRDNGNLLSFALLSKPKPIVAADGTERPVSVLNLFEDQMKAVEPNEKHIPYI